MNRSQLGLLLVGAVLVVLALLYRPYYVDGVLFGGTVYRLPVDRPDDGMYEPNRLGFEMFVIAMFAGTSMYAAREGGGRLDRFVLRAGLLANASLLYYFIPQLDGIFSDTLMLGGSLIVSIASAVLMIIARLTQAAATSGRALKLRPNRELIK